MNWRLCKQASTRPKARERLGRIDCRKGGLYNKAPVEKKDFSVWMSESGLTAGGLLRSTSSNTPCRPPKFAVTRVPVLTTTNQPGCSTNSIALW